MTVRSFSLKARAVTVGLLAAAAVLGFSQSGDAALTGTINVSAIVAQACSITTARDGSLGTTLSTALSASGSQTVTVGSVTQNCNKKAGYTLTVASTNCVAGTGAKLVNTTADEYQAYSVTFQNPSSDTQANLLASTCDPANGRVVANTKVSGDSSTIAIVFTPGVNGSPGALPAAGTFSDTLTINMVVN
jgi:spore coat protein U-like protein